MKTIFLAITMIASITAMGQKLYRETKDTVDGGLIFNGIVSLENLAREPTFAWYKKGMEEYVPGEKAMNLLKFYLRQYRMVVFLGTWCDDSHDLIPKLAKVLQISHYPEASLTMYGVDRNKATTGYEHRRYEITNVPTIILFKGDLEAGRITESVKTTIEGDISAIIEKDMAGQELH